MATAIPANSASFTAAEIALATGGVLVAGAPETLAVGVCTDSRAVRANNLFVGLRGESFDGRRFVDTAVAAGASVLLVDGPVSANAAVIMVVDTLDALGRLAALHRERWERMHDGRAVVIAITGSAGKTTTKELCAASVAASLGDSAVLATRGNLNNRIGVPMTLFGLSEEHRVAVIEMGTSIRGEIAALCAIARPDVSVLVNVGVAHAEGLALENASPREAVAREKGGIIAAAGSFAIACADDAWASASLVFAADGVDTFSFGRSERARYRLIDVAFEESGRPRLTIERPAARPSRTGERARITFAVPLLGDVVAIDAAGALAAADAALEILDQDCVEGDLLEKTLARRVRSVPGRLAVRYRSDGAVVLDDTYNASPDAFIASIEVARRFSEGAHRRLVIVAGEMRELGAHAAESHERVAHAIVAARPAWLVTLGGLAESYAVAAASAGVVVDRFADAGAATVIADRISASDVVLVKASRGVSAEICVDAILARGGEITHSPEGGA
jgi:UDP-N-acetylmuramoyl-tripeptide--D-alanyl-D-alanine ligase